MGCGTAHEALERGSRLGENGWAIGGQRQEGGLNKQRAWKLPEAPWEGPQRRADTPVSPTVAGLGRWQPELLTSPGSRSHGPGRRSSAALAVPGA